MKNLFKLLAITIFMTTLISCEKENVEPYNNGIITIDDNQKDTTSVVTPKDTIVVPKDTVIVVIPKDTIIIPKDTIIIPDTETYNLNDFYGAWRLENYKLRDSSYFIQNDEDKYKIIIRENGSDCGLPGSEKFSASGAKVQIIEGNILKFAVGDKYKFYILEKTPETLKLRSVLYNHEYYLNRTNW